MTFIASMKRSLNLLAGPASGQDPDKEPEPDAAPVPTSAAVVGPRAGQKPQLDLAFLCDCTGSMGEYILSAQQNIRSIVDRVARGEKADVRFALVAYRDHPPEDESFVTRVHPFTADVEAMGRYVNTMEADGGGDGPEAVTAALDDALRLPWRPGATKVAVLIADAPPHGLEPHGDGFPNGDPEGRDPLEIARRMAKSEITCYTVGCEPALGEYRFARDFMCTLAEITGGQAVALESAALLADVIVNGSAEEISLALLQREVEQEFESVQRAAAESREALDDAECVSRAWHNLQSKNVRSKHLRTDGAMKNAHTSIWHKSEAQTLAACKAELCAVEHCEASPVAAGGARRSMAAVGDKRRGSGVIGALAAAFGGRRKTSHREGDCTHTRWSCRSEAESWPPEMSADDEVRVERLEAHTTKVAELAEDVISEEQVSRMFKKSAFRKGA